MKKPKTLQEKWLDKQITITKNNIKHIKKEIKDSRNILMTGDLNYRVSSLEYDLKMQKIIYSQITNYTALK